MTKWNEFEPRIIEMLSEVFKDVDYHNLSLFERRKKIYDYLYDSLSFDLIELNNNSKNHDKQIRDVLFNKKGICNPIIYIYKIMLEKVGIYGIVTFCKDVQDKHTILLVDNGNGTLSFDDVSVAIYFKTKNEMEPDENKLDLFVLEQIKEKRFDYDLKDAKEMKQGINELFPDIYYLLFPSKMVNSFFGKSDEYFKFIKPSFVKSESSFNDVINYIRSFKKQKLNINEDKINR